MLAEHGEAAALLKHACPLVHPADYTVRVGDRSVPLYQGRSLIIEDTRWPVWRDPQDHHKRRAKGLAAMEQSTEYQRQVLYAISRPLASSFLLWLNWFGWTFVQQEIGPDGRQRGIKGAACNRPFITWPTQDRFAAVLLDAILQGHDVAVDKSRQMGATWLIAAMLLWLTLYQRSMSFAVLSRTEALVDNPGDPQSVFWKLDYMQRRLPRWMVPRITRHKLKIINEDLGSTIMGRSTTSEQGRGGAVNAALIDEASQIDELEEIWTSFGQSTACRIANSTPYGASYFSTLVRQPGTVKLRLPWWEHPAKGRGRTVETDPDTGEQFIASPFYIEQCRRASADPDRWWLGRKTREVAQELDMDHAGSGALVFDYPVIVRQLAACPPGPDHRGELVYDGPREKRLRSLRDGTAGALIDWRDNDRGHWELWLHLDDVDGRPRPNQDRHYVLFADVAQGVGASESTLSVFCPEEGKKVAQYRNANIDPIRFALMTARAGFWFGGAKGHALIGFEANGYGQSFGRTLVKVGYPWIQRDTEESGRGIKTLNRLGWHSTKIRKRTLFDQLRGAMARGEFVNPSRAALEQAAEIVNYRDGGIGPARLEVESEDARSLHADLVTSDAGCWYASLRMPFAKSQERVPSRGSAAWRRKQREQANANR